MNCKSEVMDEAKEDFSNVIMPKTKQAIKELIAETDKDHRKQCRVKYLQEKMGDTIVETWELLDRYWDYKHREKMIEMLLVGEKIQRLVKTIVKLQGEIIALLYSGKGRSDMTENIRKAKEYPLPELIELNKYNMARCPFHEDRNPSMRYYPESNIAYCFSCHRSWDTIAFVMERDGMTFREAVRKLC